MGIEFYLPFCNLTHLQSLAWNFKALNHIELIQNFLHSMVLEHTLLLHFPCNIGQVDKSDEILWGQISIWDLFQSTLPHGERQTSNRDLTPFDLQTILRREGHPRPYEALLALTRTHTRIDAQAIADFIAGLPVSDDIKAELSRITPHNYTGIVDY